MTHGSLPEHRQMLLNTCESTVARWNSFDHDLGGDDIAMRVVKRMVEIDLDGGGKFIPACFVFFVRSANPVGARNIESYLNCYLAQKLDQEP